MIIKNKYVHKYLFYKAGAFIRNCIYCDCALSWQKINILNEGQRGFVGRLLLTSTVVSGAIDFEKALNCWQSHNPHQGSMMIIEFRS